MIHRSAALRDHQRQGVRHLGLRANAVPLSAPPRRLTRCNSTTKPSSAPVSSGPLSNGSKPDTSSHNGAPTPLHVESAGQAQDYFQPTPLQDVITQMQNWDTFLAAVQKDTTLHQDLLSFVNQPWVDRPWFKINTHPAVSALFNDPARSDSLNDLADIINTIDHSLTPAQAKWFVSYLRDVSTAPVIYTAMTNLSSRVFDYAALDALERTTDAALSDARVTKLLKAMKVAMKAPVPPEVAAATPEGGSPVVYGSFAGFQEYWTKQRRLKYLNIYDAVQTDEHYARVGKFMHQMLPFSKQEFLDAMFTGLDSALPQERLNRLAVKVATLLGGTWGQDVALKLDAGMPESRVRNLLLALDKASDATRLERFPHVVESVSAACTPPRVERAFVALEMLLDEERTAGYGALIDAAVADPTRLERYTAAAERLLDARTVGGLLDLAAVLLTMPGRLDKVFHAMDDEWGDTEKLARWLDAVDTVNLGSDRKGTKLLAIADLATTTKPGCPSGVGLPNLWAALEVAVSGHRMEAIGNALDRSSLYDMDKFANAIAAAPTVVKVLDVLLPTEAALRLLRGLDTVMAEGWARKELAHMVDVTLGEEGGAEAVLKGTAKIMWATHGAMFKEVLGGAK